MNCPVTGDVMGTAWNSLEGIGGGDQGVGLRVLEATPYLGKLAVMLGRPQPGICNVLPRYAPARRRRRRAIRFLHASHAALGLHHYSQRAHSGRLLVVAED